MDKIYDRNGRYLGYLSDETVYDACDKVQGEVWEPGGLIKDKRGWKTGEVDGSGRISGKRGWRIGYVEGTNVYDDSDSLVGSVSAETREKWPDGLSDAHRAGAALFLLIYKDLLDK